MVSISSPGLTLDVKESEVLKECHNFLNIFSYFSKYFSCCLRHTLRGIF